MKIRIEIDTNEPSPHIANLVSDVVEQALKNHCNDNGDLRLETGDGYVPLDDLSVDDTLLTRLEATHARIEASNVSRGSMIYALEDSGPKYSLTFTLETIP